MQRLYSCLIGFGVAGALSGCGQGSAAPIAQAPAAPRQPLKLEPAIQHVTPAAPKLPASDSKKETAAAAPANQNNSAEAKPAETRSISATDRSSERGDRGDRRMRRMGQPNPSSDQKPRESDSKIVPARPPGEPSGEGFPSPGSPGGDGGFGDGGGMAIGFDGPPPGGDSAKSLKKGYVPATGLPEWFAKYDTDGDGQIALHEWPADKSMEEFAKYDLNGDGFITPQEVLRVLGPPKNVASTEGSAGTSATPSPSSWPAAPTNSAAAPPGNPVVSNDGNGRFTITMNPGGRPGGPPDRGPGGDPNRPRFGGRGGSNQTPEQRAEWLKGFIAQNDKNGDGKLSIDELPVWFRTIRDRFAEFDTNKDGALDAQELQAAFDAMRRARGGGF